MFYDVKLQIIKVKKYVVVFVVLAYPRTHNISTEIVYEQPLFGAGDARLPPIREIASTCFTANINTDYGALIQMNIMLMVPLLVLWCAFGFDWNLHVIKNKELCT